MLCQVLLTTYVLSVAVISQLVPQESMDTPEFTEGVKKLVEENCGQFTSIFQVSLGYPASWYSADKLQQLMSVRLNQSSALVEIRELLLWYCEINNIFLLELYCKLYSCVHGSYSLKDMNEYGGYPNYATLLHAACTYGHVDIVSYLLSTAQLNCNPEYQDEHGRTPLHTACISKRYFTVRYLVIKAKCNPNCQDKYGNRPFLLHLACEAGDLEFIKYLIEKTKYNPNQPNEGGKTPLHIACDCRQFHIIKYLVTEVMCDLTYQDKDGVAPCIFHAACEGGDLEFIKHLADKMAHFNPNQADERGSTPLHVACRNGFLNIVKYLITEVHCNPKLQDSDGKTPLHIACTLEKLGMVRFLTTEVHCNPNLPDNYGRTPLHIACRMRSLGIVKYLISEVHSNPELRDNKGNTTLLLACKIKSLDIVKYLISEGFCSPDFKDEEGRTPMHIVCDSPFTQDKSLARYLASVARCNPNSQDKYGRTPLHIACHQGDLDMVRLLMHCKLNCRDKDGNIPYVLHLACRKGNLEFIKYLTSKTQCDLNQEDANGTTPFHVACQYGQSKVVQYLVTELHCNPSYQDKYGWNGLHYACKDEYATTDVAQYLIQEDLVDPCSQTLTGETALHVACMAGHSDLAKLLISSGKFNANARTRNGNTPLEVASKFSVMKILIDSGATASHHHILEAAANVRYGEHPTLSSGTKVFILGNSEAGKTTLVQALQNQTTGLLQSFTARVRNVKGVDTLTAGIVISEFESEALGHLIIHDFAGQPEYYASHGVILESSTSLTAPILLLAIKLNDCNNDIEDQLLFWLSFIHSQVVPGRMQPQLIVIGTHQDRCSKSVVISKRSLIAECIRNSSALSSLQFVGIITLDCRKAKSKGMTQLKHQLKESCGTLYAAQALDFRCRLMYAFLYSAFRKQLGCQVSTIQQSILDIKDKPAAIQALDLWDTLYKLDSAGQILLLKNHKIPENSWIVVDKEQIVSTIFGILFAPNYFKEHHHLASNTGIMPVSKLAVFEGIDSELIIRCLTHLEFCQMIDDPTVLQVLQFQDPTQVNQPYKLESFQGSYLREHPTSLGQFCLQTSKLPSTTQITGEEMCCKHTSDTTSTSSPKSAMPVPSRQMFIESEANQHKHSESGIITFSTDISSEIHASNLLSKPTPPSIPNVQASEESDCSLISSTQPEKYLFFPSLVNLIRPEVVWERQDKFDYHCGWYLCCAERTQFFTSRFLQVLLLRLAFSFAIPSPQQHHADASGACIPLNRKCSVWKNGIQWLSLKGIEVVVEVIGQNKGVMVIMRCYTQAKLQCVYHRTEVVHMVIKTKEDFCKKVDTLEYLLPPSELKQFPEQMRNLTLFDIQTVARAVVDQSAFVSDHTGEKLIEIDNLLFFESYANLDTHILREVFKKGSTQKEIPARQQSDIAKKLHSKFECLDQAVDVPNDLLEILQESIGYNCRRVNYEQLGQRLDKYSIFCGRNPLVLSLVAPGHSEIIPPTSQVFTPKSFEYNTLLGEVENFVLGIDSLLEVRTELIRLVSWHHLGLALGLHQSTIETIKIEQRENVGLCLTDTLAAWLQMADNVTTASWRSLATALQSPIVGEVSLAERIATYHVDKVCTHSNHSGATSALTGHLFQNVDDAPLGEVDLFSVKAALVGGHDFSWFHLGLTLGLFYSTLKTIQRMNRENFSECLGDTLVGWLRKIDGVYREGKPSWRTLARALVHPLVNQRSLAEEIANNYRIEGRVN